MFADYLDGDENALPPDPTLNERPVIPEGIDMKEIGRRKHICFLTFAWLLFAIIIGMTRPLTDKKFEVDFSTPIIDVIDENDGWQQTLNNLPTWIQPDKSYRTRPSTRRLYDHKFFSLGYYRIKTEGRIYDHWYLGIFERWIPLPYFPVMHKQKTGFPGICIPPGLCAAHVLFSRKFRDDDLVTVLLAPVLLIFGAWQWTAWWTDMFKHTTMSMSALKHGRLHCFFLGPLSQRNWQGVLHQCFVFAHTIGDMHWIALLGNFYGACWITWFIMHLWKPNEGRASMGGTAGCTALLMYDCFMRPEVKRGFGLGIGPSIPLTTPQMMLVHMFMHWGAELVPPMAWGFMFYLFGRQHQ